MNHIKNGPADYEPADIVIYIRGKGMVLKEKSLVAYDQITNKILAMGTDAERMTGKESENISVMSPLRRGVVADYFVAVQLFTWLLEKAWGKKPLFRTSVAVCVPEDMTEVEIKALVEVMCQSRTKDVTIIPFAVEQFVAMAKIPEKLPPAYKKCRTVVGITKDEPENYVKEELGQILKYAGENGISTERITDLLKKVSEEVKELPQALQYE